MKSIILTLLLLSYCCASAETGAWTARKQDVILFTKESHGIGSGEIKTKHVLSFWCTQDTWDAQPNVQSLADIDLVFPRQQAIQLAQTQATQWKLDWDLEQPTTQLIVKQADGDMKFFYYIQFPNSHDFVQPDGVVVLPNGEVRRSMPQLVEAENWRWDNQRD
ncbi:hypothetical protein [Cerasicoccus fimbriatus]|uniref:hypothetical protein n=1 Tax=Cerasicoccus fimbriatus TaxID=3014554 RepID=UPI0022B47A9F|nr:hypothetical protein [Cerasicoccus sp. TK19100]